MKTKNLKRNLIIRTCILLLFLLIVNTYAWFVFFNKADGNINVNVVKWDVKFYDNDNSTNEVPINLTNVKPGMETFERQIITHNYSEVDTNFGYELDTLNMFGNQFVKDTDFNSNEIINSLANDYPFKITFEASNTFMPKIDGTSIFTIRVNWPYESETPYYKLTNKYEFRSDFNYYIMQDGAYKKAEVTPENFKQLVSAGLFLTSDDADTYWGERATEFLTENPEASSISMHITLIVTQA